MSEDYMSATDQVELLPGFTVIEVTPGHTVLKIPSGYTIKVKRLPPFLFDLKQGADLKDPGPFKITIKVLEKLKPPGYDQEILYEPPKDDEGRVYCPDREEHEQAWVYFQQWRAHEADRNDRYQLRIEMQWDLALVNCIAVLDGPDDMTDDDWFEPLLEFIEGPTSLGARKVLFLKSQVIGDIQTRDVIRFLYHVEEVTLEGLKTAFDSFRRELQRQTDLSTMGQLARKFSEVQSESLGDSVRE